MKFSAASAALVLTVLPALAAPVVEADVAVAVENLEKRDLSAYVCEGENFSGRCINFIPTWNKCYPFAALGLNGYRSWGPGSGTTCLWYTGDACTGTQSGAVNPPGYSSVPGFWVSNTASWKCWN